MKRAGSVKARLILALTAALSAAVMNCAKDDRQTTVTAEMLRTLSYKADDADINLTVNNETGYTLVLIQTKMDQQITTDSILKGIPPFRRGFKINAPDGVSYFTFIPVQEIEKSDGKQYKDVPYYYRSIKNVSNKENSTIDVGDFTFTEKRNAGVLLINKSNLNATYKIGEKNGKLLSVLKAGESHVFYREPGYIYLTPVFWDTKWIAQKKILQEVDAHWNTNVKKIKSNEIMELVIKEDPQILYQYPMIQIVNETSQTLKIIDPEEKIILKNDENFIEAHGKLEFEIHEYNNKKTTSIEIFTPAWSVYFIENEKGFKNGHYYSYKIESSGSSKLLEYDLQQEPKEIQVKKVYIEISLGNINEKIEVKVLPDTVNQRLVFETSDDQIVKVDEEGNLIPQKKGATSVTCYSVLSKDIKQVVEVVIK